MFDTALLCTMAKRLLGSDEVGVEAPDATQPPLARDRDLRYGRMPVLVD
jgi:hypothetical protein